MHLKYFADSYEYVKRALINAIAEPQEWVVHPMLFRSIDGGGLAEDWTSLSTLGS